MKDFARVLILQQVEAGKLKLSDKLVTFELGFKQPDADIFVAEYRQNQLAFDTLNKKIKILIKKTFYSHLELIANIQTMGTWY